MIRICLKIFFLLSTFPMIIQISGKRFRSKKIRSMKKLPISKVKKSNFDQTKYAKYCLRKAIKFGTLTQLTFFLSLFPLFLKSGKCFKSYRKYKKMKFEGDWADL